MQKQRLIMAYPSKDTVGIKRIFSEVDSVQWLYLGQNFFKRRYIEHDLGTRFKRIDITKLHDDVARDIRVEHIKWVDDLNRLNGDSQEWWFGSISSRSPYNNNIFQYCCYLEILERLDALGKKPDLVFIESRGLAKTIKKWAEKKNIIVKMVYYDRAQLATLRFESLFFVKWGIFIVTLSLRWIAAYISSKKFNPKELKVDQSIILDTYVHDHSISNDGIFKDRYFPYLHEYLSANNMYVFVHPVLFGFRFNFFSIYMRMRKSGTNFIIREDFLHFSDYLLAIIYPIKAFSIKIKANPFRDFDLSYIIREEKKLQSVIPSMEAILIYRLFLRLGLSGLRPKLIIDWYENQIIDKALIAGARQAIPQVRIIGAQMVIHSDCYSRLFPSESEVEAQIAPDILLETSTYECQIAQSFSKNIPCKSAAALRYSHLFNTDGFVDINQKHPKILILLSFNIAEAVELLENLKDGLGQIRAEIPILIKGHPDYDTKKLVAAFGKKEWPERFEIFHGNLPEALNQASLVISSNSGSIVEAAARGIPVISMGSQTTINYNILSNINMNIVTECFSVSELIEAIKKYIDISSTERDRYKEMGIKIRDLFFEPVNKETLSPFLDIDTG